MTIALVLGGADTLAADVARYTGPYDGVVACNDAGAWWPGKLDAWVTLHPEFLAKWMPCREGQPAGMLVSHRQPKPSFDRRIDLETGFMFPGMFKSASSGLFAAKVALCDLGFDHAVLCGIPLQSRPHFFNDQPWLDTTVEGFRRQWLKIPHKYRGRMRSMSGWTRTLLGAPEWTNEAGYRRLIDKENHHADATAEQSHG